MSPMVLSDSNYLHGACIAKLSLSARVRALQHIRPRAHGPGTRISQQQAPSTVTYLSLTAQPPPGSQQTWTSTAPSRTRRSHGDRATTRSVPRALCGPSRVHCKQRRHRTGKHQDLTSSRQYVSEGRRTDGKVCQCRIVHLRYPQQASND